MRDTSRSLHPSSKSQTGLTLLELVMACAILLVLASAAMPLARFTVKREKEAELRRDLREMRDSIDRYKDAADRHLIRVEAGTEGYPPDLQTLVQGVDLVAQPGAGTTATAPAGQSGFAAIPFGSQPAETSGAGGEAIRRVRFLRRVPVDPMTGRAEWGLRAVQDPPDSTSWSGKDVFDVYSLSNGTALDGTQYSSW
jgi:general secretion pathway protein G